MRMLTKFWSRRMNEHQKPHNPEMEFERQDLQPRGVYNFLVGLGVGCALVALFLWGAYHSLDAYSRRHQPPQNPIAPPANTSTRFVTPDDVARFPQPRLEQNERIEINEFRLKEEQTLNSYGWADEKAGVARIPIDRAMQLVAQRGLPTTPRIGAVPSSTVSLGQEAAQRSDTSNASQQKKVKK
jgi:hypothetical protein